MARLWGRLLAGLLVVALVIGASPLRAQAPAEEAEPALVLTLKWEAGGVAIETVDRREMVVPAQLGFPQLKSRFFELQNKDGDVYYSGPLVDPRVPGGDPTATRRLVLPDREDARHLVFYQRVGEDPDTGRKVLLERDL